MTHKSPTQYEVNLSPLSWALIFLCPLLWTVNYLVARTSPPFVTPHVLAAGRWFLAALILAVFCRKELFEKRHLLWQDRWHFVALSLLGMWMCGAWIYLGARTTSATNIALIYALSPMFIVLGAAYLLHEKLRRMQVLGVVLALVGLVHVVIRGDWAQLSKVEFITGDLLVLACAMAWAVYALLLKRWPSALSPLARLVVIAFSGSLIMLPLALWEIAAQTLGATTWGWQTFGLIIAAAALPGAGAYGAYAMLQRRIGAARTASVLYLGPLYSAVTAYFVLGERLHPYHAVGGAVILVGIYLSNRQQL